MRLAVAALAVALGLCVVPARAEDLGREADRALADLERYMAELEKHLDAFGAEARARFEAKRPLIRRRLAELRKRGDRAWRHLRSEVDRALDELERDLQDGRVEPELPRT
jgi:hypothetical protein